MNLADVLLIVAIVAALALAVWLIVRSRAKTGCASCPFAEGCSRRDKDKH